ncbi:hypothetical protein F2Q70_00043050 [Brassica cretica]|uniref:Uncharacterized protein n=1 Tax=Brassica cretica TaxID=69181 RepID=A0A8S9KHK7_BRACR|nr:hypothetical protein F2Q70_00043050 [Brassica cretica]
MNSNCSNILQLPAESLAESPAAEKGWRLTGINGGDGQRLVLVAREIHAQNVWRTAAARVPHARNDAGEKPRLTARHGGSVADLPAPDSSQRHEHDGGGSAIPSMFCGGSMTDLLSVDGGCGGTVSDLDDGSDSTRSQGLGFWRLK